MRSLSLDQLRTLIDVIELGSFSAAARRLNLTQPAVSLQIRELEARLGVRLIDRQGKRAFATTAGKELMEHGRRIIADADRALAAMRRYKDGRIGRVHIGTGTTALTYLLPSVLKRLRATYPDIEIVVTTGTTHSVAERMMANLIDIGFVSLPVDEREFNAVRVREDALVAIMPPTYAAAVRAITAEEIARHPLILEYERANHSRLSREWLRNGGVDARPIMEVDNIEAIKNMVSASMGVSIIPIEAVGKIRARTFVCRPLQPPLTRTLAIIERRNKPEDDAVRAVREALMTLAHERDSDADVLAQLGIVVPAPAAARRHKRLRAKP